MSDKCDFGLIGLAVMGENLALNIESRGYRIAVYNRTTSKVDDLIEGRAAGKNFVGCHSLQELVDSLAAPRKVMMLVKAGPAVDSIIEQLLPLLSPGASLLMVVTPTTPTPNDEPRLSKTPGCFIVDAVFRAVKKERC